MSAPSSIDDKVAFEQKENAYAADGALNRDPKIAKRAFMKIDLRVTALLAALYTISLIDRTNLAAARLAGMGDALKLTVGERYSLVTLVFFPSYIAVELFSNLLIRKIGVKIFLCSITYAWGAVMIGMGFTKTWTQLLGLRILLGIFEGGLFPACLYIISSWYPRYQTAKRLSFFFLFGSMLSGFTSAMGYGILKNLNGVAGHAAWTWVFLVFGIVTLGLAVIANLFMVEFPDKATFLKPEELALVRTLINEDRGDAEDDGLTVAKFIHHAKDFKPWLIGFLFFACTVPAYAFGYFLPIILKGAGYSTKDSLLLSAPPYAVASVWGILISFASDKLHLRGPFIFINGMICLIGLSITAYAGPPNLRYFGTFFVCMGANGNVPSCMVYLQNNICSYSKRATGSGIFIFGGALGGMVSSLVFRQKDYPRYVPGLWFSIGWQMFTMVTVVILTVYFKIRNGQADRGERILEETPGFRYTY